MEDGRSASGTYRSTSARPSRRHRKTNGSPPTVLVVNPGTALVTSRKSRGKDPRKVGPWIRRSPTEAPDCALLISPAEKLHPSRREAQAATT
uniref:Uncharacterized protein n=1 Tax=Mycena chlorophos TaxID=658473 RepID=A0ABQ0L019_MYCCL|nr:predicted protein [Mycena chlorophos]